MATELDIVTGAFGYTGRHVAARLLEKGRRVRTLTAHPDRPNPFGDRMEMAPLDLDRPERLVEDLRGATTLYNTCWIRFPRGEVTFERAGERSLNLMGAAREAGVRRIVHVSITNPSEDSPFAYFRGKARVERAIVGSGLGYAIVRPTVIFGREDILLNNIAYLLRRLPVFGIPGSGSYRIRPVSVEDVADLCVRGGSGSHDETIDAVGPETFTFEELVRLIARTVRSRALIVHVPRAVALAAATAIGRVVGDVVVTADELDGLMAELVTTDGPSSGTRSLGEWLQRNSATVGTRYASEVGRHYRA